MTEKKDIALQFRVSKSLLLTLDQWRFQSGIWSRGSAIRQLISNGISAQDEDESALRQKIDDQQRRINELAAENGELSKKVARYQGQIIAAAKAVNSAANAIALEGEKQ